MESIKQRKTERWASSVRGDLNRYMQDLIYHLNLRANWLITIASFILVFVMSNLSKFNTNILTTIGLSILMIGSVISLISLMLILVPYVKAPRNYYRSLDGDIFYFRNIECGFTKEEFIEYLGRLRSTAEELDRIYGASIYNNATVRLPSITAKLKIGGWSLIIALVVGSLFVFLGFIL